MHGKSCWIMDSQPFKDWLLARESHVLAIDPETSYVSGRNGLTYASAMVALNVIRDDRFPALSFHTTQCLQDDDFRSQQSLAEYGINAVLLNLQGQLAEFIRAKRQQVDHTRLPRVYPLPEGKFSPVPVPAVHPFHHLAQTIDCLPAGDAVFITIDGVSLLGVDPMGCLPIVAILNDLLLACPRHIIKILVTDTRRVFEREHDPQAKDMLKLRVPGRMGNDQAGSLGSPRNATEECEDLFTMALDGLVENRNLVNGPGAALLQEFWAMDS
jgi:hypothetical protein